MFRENLTSSIPVDQNMVEKINIFPIGLLDIQYICFSDNLVFFIPMVKLADVISQWMEQVYLFSFQYVSQDPTGPSWQGKYILPD
jgi:hypothetical protein